MNIFHRAIRRDIEMLLVLLLGATRALNFFAPLQRYIGVGPVLLRGWKLRLRAKALASTCSGVGKIDKRVFTCHLKGVS